MFLRGLPGALSADLIVLKGLRGAQGASTKIALSLTWALPQAYY